MNGLQLQSALLSNPTTKKNYGGIFNNQTLENVYRFDKYYIVNTITNSMAMGHWILFIFHFGELLFIDSFAQDVSAYGGKIEQFYIKCPYKKKMLIHKQIQSSDTLVCGIYSMYFAYHITKNTNIPKIMRRFNYKKTQENDKFILKFYFRFTNTNVKCHEKVCPGLTFENECRPVCICPHTLYKPPLT